MLLAAGGLAVPAASSLAQVVVTHIVLSADASTSTSSTPDVSDRETALGPLFAWIHGGDGVARADALRSGAAGAPFYASALQEGTANAVAAQSAYVIDRHATSSASTMWAVGIKNLGTASVPIDFSFYISGGQLRLWCVACVTDGLTTEVTAEITLATAASKATQWKYGARLRGTPQAGGAVVSLTDGPATGSVDHLGIGFPTPPEMVELPSASGPFTFDAQDHVAAVGSFSATAALLTLQPDETAEIIYSLTARVDGIGQAYGTAWLTDPFGLGGDPALPSARFAINGIPIETLVPIAGPIPEPRQWLLLAAGLAVIAWRRRTARET